MASALEAVLALKANQQEQERRKSDEIMQASQIFQQARQQAIANQLAQMQMKASLAEKGLVPDSSSPSGFKRDTSLQDPMTNFLQGLKIQAEAKTANNPQAYLLGQQLTGLPNNNPSDPSIAINNPIESANETISQDKKSNILESIKKQANQRDVFGELTPQAKTAQEQLKAESSPLSGESASKFAGAEQGIKNIKETIDFINNYKGDKRELILQANKVVEAANAKDTWLPGGKGIYRASKLSGTSEDAKILANKFSTIAENLLRARTGAAATQDEINREYARSLLMTVNEGTQGWNQKLKNNYNFLKNTFDEIRPLRKDNPDYILNSEIQSGEKKILTKEQADMELKKAEQGQTPLAILSSALDIGSRPAINSSLLGIPDLVSKISSGEPYVKENTPNSTVLSLLGGSGSFATANRLNNILKTGQAAEKVAATNAQSALTKLKGDEIINSAVKNARDKITGPGGYISQEHNIYSKAIDTIKGTEKPVEGADNLLSRFALNNKNETTGQFKTSEMQKVYDTLNKKFISGEKITDTDIVNSMKELKGKFGTGKVDAHKRMNLNAASDLAKGLSKENFKILEAADTRYSVFKTNEKNIDDLISIYGKAKKTDAVVSNLLSKDLGIEQSKVAKLIGDKTGLDLLNTINYHRGVNQVKDSFWLTRQIDSLLSGGKKVMKSKLDEILPKK